MDTISFRRLWDDLLAEGCVAITSEEIAERAGTSLESVYVATHRAAGERLLFSPARGLHVLVPPEYRSWGSVPADWFIDDMMSHLGTPYYVAYLSAAARHGASHQAAQQFQVVTGKRVESRTAGRVRLRFYSCSSIAARASERQNGPTGALEVATPETCLLDLAENPDAGGGLATLVEIIGELPVDADALVDAAALRPRAAVRRAAWLLARTQPQLDLGGLEQHAEPGVGRPTPLVAGQPPSGRVDRRWGLDVNTAAGGSS